MASLTTLFERLLDSDDVVYECRNCGETVDAVDVPCPNCGTDEIAEYRVD